MIRKLITIIALVGLTGCITTNNQQSSLELQAFQKQQFNATKKVAFASLMSVLQDLGYIIKAADFETGIITGASPTKNTVFFGSYMSNTEVSAFVETLNPKLASIRLTFVEVSESSSGYGMKSKRDKPVVDPLVYQNAFDRISEAIFIRTSNADA